MLHKQFICQVIHYENVQWHFLPPQPRPLPLLYSYVQLASTVFPQLDALHVLEASAHFDTGCSGRNTF